MRIRRRRGSLNRPISAQACAGRAMLLCSMGAQAANALNHIENCRMAPMYLP